MQGFLHVVTLIGSLLGIATAVFIVYDRIVRGRPIFALDAKRRVHGDNYLYLRIKNVLDQVVVIENWRVAPPLVGLSTDVSPRSIAAARVGNIPTMIVPPLGELTLSLIVQGAATDRHTEQVTISANWDTTQKPWLFRRKVQIKMTVARLEELKGAHLPDEKEKRGH